MSKATITEIKKTFFTDIISIPVALNKPYYSFMDGMRGIAIIYVVLFHLSYGKKWGSYIDASIGVHLFFILSGFLITTLLLKEKINAGSVSLKKFYIRRALRILPVAYLFVLTLVLINLIFKLNISYKSFLAAIFYVKNFPITGDWYSGHFWTLSIEEQFYLFAPIILISSTSKYLKFIIILLILVPVADYLVVNTMGVTYTKNHLLYTITYNLLHTFFHAFNFGTLYILSGSLLSFLMFKKIVNVDKLSGKYYLSFILFACACFIHFPNTNYFIPYLSSIIFTLLICVVIALNIKENNLLTVILNNPILVKIGVLSYSIYIWQQLFTANQPWKGLFKYSDSIFFNLPILFIVAYLSYNLYEKQFLTIKNKRYTNNIKRAG